ncbi:MAG: GNAT family N-acetyltransferase [Ktedonobacteraceae bacterium]
MQPICLHNKHEIEAFLLDKPLLHLYELGDLDDFFWPYTTWYALKDAQRVQQLALLYTGTALPVLLAISDTPAPMRELLIAILHLLPRRFYAHLSANVTQALTTDYHLDSHGPHYKMALRDRTLPGRVDTSHVEQLSVSDRDTLAAMYRASYPGNWFDPRMLETGYYIGIRHGPAIVSVAGVHVYSRQYNAAALGNVATHPDWRGRGLGTAVCAKLCQALSQSVEHIGLNVKTNNASAIASYTRLGFETIATYEEYMCELRTIR